MKSVTDSGIKVNNLKENKKSETRHNLIFAGICLIIGIMIIMAAQLISIGNSNVEFISAKEIESYDHSQLSITDGTDYYSWYDWDRRSGKVYIVTKVDGDVISIVPAYGKDGTLLYVDLEEMEHEENH